LRVRIEDGALLLRPQQGLVLVLAVQVHQSAPQLAHERGGRGRAADPRPAAPRRRDLAPEDQVPVLGFQPLVREQLQDVLASLDVEDAFHHGAVGACPDQVRGRPLPEQEGQRTDDDGLPCSRLAGQDVQPRSEPDGDAVDDCEVLDAQLEEHTRVYPDSRGRFNSERSRQRASSPRSIAQWSLRRSVEKKLCPGNRTSRSDALPRRTRSRSPGVSAAPSRPSTVSMTSALGLSTSTLTTAPIGRTSGRTARVWGQIGVARMQSTPGTTIAPPAESE